MTTPLIPLDTSARILVVEDNERLAFGLRMALESHGYQVHVAHDGPPALETLRRTHIDLVLLDILLPTINGFSLAATIRLEFPNIRIIAVSALDEESDKVRAFRAGMHDYVAKPFGTRELVERVRVQVERSSPQVHAVARIINMGELTFDTHAKEVYRHGKSIHLTKLERDLLFTLIKAKGAVCTKEYLLHEVWHHKNVVPTRTIDYHIGRLRAKLEDHPRSPRLIITEWKTGYRFGGATFHEKLTS